jgi:hypothetical protein
LPNYSAIASPKYPLKNYEGEKLALMKQDILEIAILEATPAQ